MEFLFNDPSVQTQSDIAVEALSEHVRRTTPFTWHTKRKIEVIDLVLSGRLTIEQAAQLIEKSVQEIQSWVDDYVPFIRSLVEQYQMHVMTPSLVNELQTQVDVKDQEIAQLKQKVAELYMESLNQSQV